MSCPGRTKHILLCQRHARCQHRPRTREDLDMACQLHKEDQRWPSITRQLGHSLRGEACPSKAALQVAAFYGTLRVLSLLSLAHTTSPMPTPLPLQQRRGEGKEGKTCPDGTVGAGRGERQNQDTGESRREQWLSLPRRPGRGACGLKPVLIYMEFGHCFLH